jgi:hypothetical protein
VPMLYAQILAENSTLVFFANSSTTVPVTAYTVRNCLLQGCEHV